MNKINSDGNFNRLSENNHNFVCYIEAKFYKIIIIVSNSFVIASLKGEAIQK